MPTIDMAEQFTMLGAHLAYTARLRSKIMSFPTYVLQGNLLERHGQSVSTTHSAFKFISALSNCIF